MPASKSSEIETVQIRPQGPNLSMLSGEIVEEFQLGEVIGKGGAGVVYAAEDKTLHRQVAFKILSPAGIDGSGETKARFLREARAVAKLDHPNVVQVYRIGEYAGANYIVMQLVDGQTLSEYVADQSAISTDEALRITRQVAEALRVAHKQGITHRDIKPSNIMIDAQGHVKVMDFGLARHGESDGQLTEPGMYMGTPKYSSPEQCETKSIDQRTDLYSLGVILYELLSGQSPHQAKTPMALMHQIIYESPEDIRTLKKDLPEPVCKLVDKLLAKEPSKRVQTADNLIVSINDILGESGSQLMATRNKRLGMWAIFGLIAAAVVIVGVIVANRLNAPLGPAPVAVPAAKQPFGDQVKFAMYDFQNLTKDTELQWMEIGMSDLITANLSQYPRIKVLSRDQIIWSGSDAAGGPPSQVNDDLRPRLQDLEVEVVAKGQIVRVKDEVRVVTILYRLGEDEILKSFSHTGNVDDLFGLVDRLGDDISKYFVGGGEPVRAIAVAAAEQSADQVSSKGTWSIFSRRIANGTPAYAMASLKSEVEKASSKVRSKTLAVSSNEKRQAGLLKPRRMLKEGPVRNVSAEAITAKLGRTDPSLELAQQASEGSLKGGSVQLTAEVPVADIAIDAAAEVSSDYGHSVSYSAVDDQKQDELQDAEVVKVLPHYYRGLRFLSEKGIPPDSPSACRVTLCRELAAEHKKGRSLSAVLKRWQERVLSNKKP